MDHTELEISVVYTDNFSESYTVDEQTFKKIIQEAKDESRKDFHIGGKQFMKKDIAVLATANCSIEFL